MLQLLCYMRGNDYQRVFSVKIKEDEIVGTLKDIIKEKASQHFLNTGSLLIWKVSLPYDQNLKEKVEALRLTPDTTLQPIDTLSDLFSSGLLNKRTVHIVVDRPSSSEL